MLPTQPHVTAGFFVVSPDLRTSIHVPPASAIVRSVNCLRALPSLKGLLLLLVLVGSLQAPAQKKAPVLQESRTGTNRPSPVRYEVASIIFEGNQIITSTELSAQMLTRETPGWLGKFLFNSISERLGRKNEYYDPITFSSDLDRLKRYYVNHGFNEAAIDTQMQYDADRGIVDLRLTIAEGRRSLIDTIDYRGLVYDPYAIYEEIYGSPKIQKGDPFNLTLLEEEVNRVLVILRNMHYPNSRYLRDSSSAVRYASSGNYRVVLSFRSGKQYRFGDIAVVQEIDSLRSPEPRTDITDDIILDHMDYAPGDLYGADKIANSQVNLNRLGILELRSIKENVPSPQDTSTRVPTTVTYLPRDKNELAPEVIVSDDYGAFNLGLGLGYTQRNFFGGARIASTRIRFQTQTLGAVGRSFDKNSDAVSTVDLTYEIQQPTVLTNRIRGTWSFSGIIDKQKPYLQYILRNKFGFTGRFAEFTTGYLDWTLEFVDLRLNSSFQVYKNDPELQLQILRIQQQQFNSILGFTIQRDKSNDLFSPSAGFVHSLTIQEAGLLPLLLRRTFPSIPFTQFYRLSAIGRWYYDLSDHRFSILALKAKGGIEGKYGESHGDTNRTIPQTHRFYGGGSSSVRGWASRELIASGDPQLGGNLAFEGSVELRVNLLQSLRDGVLDKLWFVQFVDVGNVWVEASDLSFRTMGVAAGLGLRYDTFFGPFRIDWGFRVYNPSESPGKRWITQRRLFGQTFKQGVFHFGIGHAF
jgi:outer membrane protein insertion porin family